MVQDPFEKNVPGLGLGRDPERTPMQWDGTAGAGFTAGAPWLPVADDFKTINVASARSDAASILSLYKRLIELRRAESALSVGDFAHLPAGEDLIAYVRKAGARRLLIILNLGAHGRAFDLGDLAGSARLLLSTHMNQAESAVAGSLPLRPDEGVIIELR
jgi:alpha-glucosidase